MMNEKFLRNISCEDCVVKECLFKKSLAPEKLGGLINIKNMVRYTKGQYIFHEGAQATGVYCIFKGKIKIAKLGSEGREHIIYLAKTGEAFGLKDILQMNEHTCSSAALEDSLICHIPKADFYYFLDNDLNFAKEVRDHLCYNQNMIEEKVLNLSQKPVRERLAFHLLDINKNFGQILENDESFIDISLSRDDLANLVGTATETVIRLMSEFKKSGILALKGKKIFILNTNALRKIAQV